MSLRPSMSLVLAVLLLNAVYIISTTMRFPSFEDDNTSLEFDTEDAHVSTDYVSHDSSFIQDPKSKDEHTTNDVLEETNEISDKEVSDGTKTMKTHSSKEVKEITVANQKHADDATTHRPPEDYLLKVPFYVYEDFLHDDNLLNFTEIYHWSKTTARNTKWGTIVNNKSNVTFAEYLDGHRNWKHGGDAHFVRSALEHPMRVLNPEDAKLFVVPSLITMDISRHSYGSKEDKLKSQLRLGRINQFISDSPWFKANDGADHIAPIAYFLGEKVIQRYVPLFARCNLVQFYENPSDQSYIHPDYRDKRAMYKVFKVGVGGSCNPTAFDNKSQDFAFIGTLHRQNKPKMNRYFQNRRDMCDWLSKSKHSYSVCGYGDSCPNLAQALLGFHARGDSISAARLFSIIMSGTVPVFTLKLQYEAQPEWYDWDKLSYFANVENKTEFLADLDKIMSNKTDIMVKTQNVLDNKDLFDWQTNIPFDVYMVSAAF